MYHDPGAVEWLRDARGAGRSIVIDDVPWLVYDLPASPFDRRSGPSLVFESEETMRRIRTFPADWRSLGDEELFALSWAR
jgi:hypothetical protein